MYYCLGSLVELIMWYPFSLLSRTYNQANYPLTVRFTRTLPTQEPYRRQMKLAVPWACEVRRPPFASVQVPVTVLT